MYMHVNRACFCHVMSCVVWCDDILTRGIIVTLTTCTYLIFYLIQWAFFQLVFVPSYLYVNHLKLLYQNMYQLCGSQYRDKDRQKQKQKQRQACIDMRMRMTTSHHLMHMPWITFPCHPLPTHLILSYPHLSSPCVSSLVSSPITRVTARASEWGQINATLEVTIGFSIILQLIT